MKAHQIIYRYEIVHPFSDKNLELVGVSSGIYGTERTEVEAFFKTALSNLSNEQADVPSYSFIKLKSGRYFISYIGYDHAGNYLCRGLLNEDGYWPFYPVEMIGSKAFDFDSCEVYDSQKDLPVLDEIPLGNTINYEKVASFIKPRMDQGFSDMLCGALSFKTKSTPIIIFDDTRNLLYWIAALQMAFPVNLSHSITFTTNGEENMECMVRGMSFGDSSIIKKDNPGYIFDYRLGTKSSFKIHCNFIKIANTGFAASKAALDAFHSFLVMFDLKELDWDVEGCFNLFLLRNFRGFNISTGEIKSALQFAMSNASDDMLEDVFNMIEPAMVRVLGIADLATAGISGEFMFKAALHSGKNVLIERANYYFYNLLDRLILDNDSPDIEGATDLFRRISILNHGKSNIFFKYPLTDERIRYITEKLTQSCSPQKARYYLDILLENSIQLGYFWSQMLHRESISVLMDLCINNVSESIEDMLWVMDTAASNDEYLSKTSVLLYNRINSRDVMERFIKRFSAIMDTRDDIQKSKVRKEIASLGCVKLLFDEYAARLYCAEDVKGFFDNYQREVFDNIHELRRQYLSEAMKLYISRLPFASTYTECLNLLKSIMENSLDLDEDALSCLIKTFEESLNLSPPSEEVRDAVQELKRIKRNKDIITRPDITGLIDFGIWLEKLGAPHTVEDICEKPLDFELLDEKRYTAYIEWCIPKVTEFASSPEDYKRIIHFYDKENMDLELHLACLRSIQNILDKDSLEGKNLLLQFLVYYFFYLEPRCKLLGVEDILNNIRESIIDMLSRNSKDLVKRMDFDIKIEFQNRKLSLPIQWTSIYNEVSGRGTSRTGKGLLSLFKRK